MFSSFILAFIASLLFQGAHAAAVIARATSRPSTTRSRGSRIARGVIAAIVIASVVGIAVLVLCCYCAKRMLTRRRAGSTPTYGTPAPAMATSGMNETGMGYPQGGGGGGYGPPPGAPPQAYHPTGKNEQFVGGFGSQGVPQGPPQY